MIHPHTYIHPNAKLATNVKVDPFTVIHQDVEIGDGTWIGSNVTIMEGARIGRNCRIFPGSVIAAIPQDLKYQGEYSIVIIGDNTTIREFVTVNRGTRVKEKTVIGKNCLLMAYCHLAHDCIVGDHVILANGVQLAGHVEVGDFAIIGGLCGVQQFTRIGKHAYIGGQSAIRKDVPPYVKAAREPISYMGINVVGLHRRNFPHHQIELISQIYHLLFVGNHSTSSGLTQVKERVPDSEIKSEILQFIQDSKIGVIKRFSKNDTDEDPSF